MNYYNLYFFCCTFHPPTVNENSPSVTLSTDVSIKYLLRFTWQQREKIIRIERRANRLARFIQKLKLRKESNPGRSILQRNFNIIPPINFFRFVLRLKPGRWHIIQRFKTGRGWSC